MARANWGAGIRPQRRQDCAGSREHGGDGDDLRFNVIVVVVFGFCLLFLNRYLFQAIMRIFNIDEWAYDGSVTLAFWLIALATGLPTIAAIVAFYSSVFPRPERVVVVGFGWSISWLSALYGSQYHGLTVWEAARRIGISYEQVRFLREASAPAVAVFAILVVSYFIRVFVPTRYFTGIRGLIVLLCVTAVAIYLFLHIAIGSKYAGLGVT